MALARSGLARVEVIEVSGIVHLSAWQDADWPETADALITDPPYAPRTHAGMRDKSDGESLTNPCDYDSITEDDAIEFAQFWAPRITQWAVIFGDHTTWRWHADAWKAAGWYVFAAVIYCKTNPGPRFSGDGPTSACEWIMIARPIGRVRVYKSRRGAYVGPTANRDQDRRRAGHKPPWLLQQILSDYTEPGDVICDPFAGSATVGEVAISNLRRYVGSEIDPETHAKALRRIERAKVQPGLMESLELRSMAQGEMDLG